MHIAARHSTCDVSVEQASTTIACNKRKREERPANLPDRCSPCVWPSISGLEQGSSLLCPLTQLSIQPVRELQLLHRATALRDSRQAAQDQALVPQPAGSAHMPGPALASAAQVRCPSSLCACLSLAPSARYRARYLHLTDRLLVWTRCRPICTTAGSQPKLLQPLQSAGGPTSLTSSRAGPQ